MKRVEHVEATHSWGMQWLQTEVAVCQLGVMYIAHSKHHACCACGRSSSTPIHRVHCSEYVKDFQTCRYRFGIAAAFADQAWEENVTKKRPTTVHNLIIYMSCSNGVFLEDTLNVPCINIIICNFAI